jgi:hypothetical protein
MKRFLLIILVFPGLIRCTSSSNASSPGENVTPIGGALAGATFSGPLAGKQLYLLNAPIDPPGCWVDSEFWSGTELFFSISSLDYNALLNGTLTYNGGCTPTPPFTTQSSPGTTGNFNIFIAPWSAARNGF